MKTETLFVHGVAKAARISACRRHRFTLHREWAREGKLCGWIMLNPSTADANDDDPTIRRCMSFARDWGYRGIVVVNLFSLRATDPRELLTASDTTSPEFPDIKLWSEVAMCGVVVAAWGAHLKAEWRGRQLVKTLTGLGIPLQCLGKTKDGHPRHPLYVKGSQPLELFVAARKTEGGE